MNRTIKIKGTGQLSLAPDLAVLSLQLTALQPEYPAAIAQHEQNFNEIKTAILSCGFKAEEIKTMEMKLSMEYDRYEEKGVYKKAFTGYRIYQDLKLKFPLDNVLISQLISALAQTSVNPEVNLNFSVSNPENHQTKLLKLATLDALNKAETLCASLAVKVGQLLEIDYSWVELSFSSNSSLAASPRMMSAYAFDFNPENIELKESASFVWEII